jgi:hypothetical protein
MTAVRATRAGAGRGRLRALALGLALAVPAGELVLRAVGRGPWRERAHADDVPRMHEPDPELGWRNRPGAYVFGRDAPIRMTFWPDGSRATAPEPRGAGPVVALVGDSFTQGWAVSDAQTFGWTLQERLPHARVRNWGSAGYGTTQSLLALRRLLGAGGEPPRVAVYGFSDFHEGRNVAAAAWLHDLSEVAHRGHVAVPYATLGASGALLFHPPARYPAWPLHRHSAVIAALERLTADVDARTRTAAARAVTERLLLELDRVVRDAGGRLLVVTLSQWMPGSFGHYGRLLARHGVASADCRHPEFLSPAMQVPGYGHPNATMHAHWAGCIERALAAAGGPAAQAPSAAR